MKYNNYYTFTTAGNAGCPSDPFVCDNGDCIPQDYVCDQYDDCGDNSDEDGCGM